jgi:pimeloyl-ACP methyl ester carboxylesterase
MYRFIVPPSAPASGIAALLAGALLSFASPSGASSLTLHSCTPVEKLAPMRCGQLLVPENWSRPEKRQIGLNIVVVPATGEPKLPPLYDLEGGPGRPATAGAVFWATDGAIHLRSREVVLVDQRGTGQSNPLACELSFSDPLRELFPLGAVRDCRTQLAKMADLSRYSTDAAVRDLDAVRSALGHQQIDLTGISYGTRLAQAYAQANPTRVRAMALFAPVPPDMRLPQEFPDHAQEIMNRLLDQCAQDAGCNAAFPDLKQDWFKLRERLGAGPVRVGKQKILRGPFFEALRVQLGSVTSQRRIPWLIHEAAQDRFEPVLEAMKPSEPDPAANGLFLSVVCPEDTLHLTEEERGAAGAWAFGGNYRVKRQYSACRAWQARRIDPAFRHPVSLPTPTLMIVGTMDFVTPPAAAQRVAQHLPNSRIVEIPELGHAPIGLTGMECLDQMMAAFFDAGSASALDTSCVQSMKPPAFFVPPAEPLADLPR